jgi:hypothetical protein
MTYFEIIPKAKLGKLIKLPNFEGIFKWDYGRNILVFNNKDFWCDANNLDILNRKDFYYII